MTKISNENRSKIAIDYLVNGKESIELAKQYGVDRSTINKIVKKYQEQYPYIKSRSQINHELIKKHKDDIIRMYQVHNISLSKIANIYGVDRTTISKLIKKIV